MNIKGTIFENYAKDEDIIGQYVVLNRNITSDGFGGQEYTIVEGLSFEGVLILNTSIEGQIAQKQGVTGIYTFAYPKNLNIPPKTILRRIKDGKIFRTTDIDGVPTPDMSTLDMKTTRLEDYTLPANDVE